MSKNKITENPRDNLARMRSILVGYQRKIEHKQKVRSATEAKLTRLRDAMGEDENADTREAQSRRTIERKYLYDLSNLDKEIRELEGKIIWAERRQIPFIESEIELYDAEHGDDTETATEELEA